MFIGLHLGAYHACTHAIHTRYIPHQISYPKTKDNVLKIWKAYGSYLTYVHAAQNKHFCKMYSVLT